MYKNRNALRQSSKQLFAQSANNGTYTTVQQGQPFNVRAMNVTSDGANVLYDVVGTPKYNIIELTNVTTSKTTGFSTTSLSYRFTGLEPFHNYQVSITSFYKSNDSFKLSTPISFTTINEAAVPNVTILLPTNQLYTSTSSIDTYLDVSFSTSIGDPIYYTVDIAGEVVSSGKDTIRRINQLTRNTQYTIRITTFYPTNQYFIEKSEWTLNESSVAQMTVLNKKGNYIDISFTKVAAENAVYIVYKNGEKTDISFSYTDSIKRIPSLNPDTSYHFKLATYYPNTQNTYLSDVSINVITANENTITNIIPTIGVSDASFGFTKSPGNASYTVAISGNSTIQPRILTDQIDVSGLEMNLTYILSVSSTYSTTNNIYTIEYPFTTLFEGAPDISFDTILGTSTIINAIPFSNSQPSFYNIYLNGNAVISTLNPSNNLLA